MSRAPGRRRGFTLWEVVVGLAVSTAGMSSFVALWGASDGLTKNSRTVMRAEAEHRENLSALAALLRDAAPSSLAEFDADGRSTSPRFRRVEGLYGVTPRLSAENRLLWLPVSAWGRDDQGAPLGQVVVRAGSADRSLARRVPEGGFLVERSGRTLTISLATYWRPEEAGPLRRIHDQVEICLRN